MQKLCLRNPIGNLLTGQTVFFQQRSGLAGGDIVYIHDTGAHGSAMGYNYNGKLRSAEVLLCEDGSHRLIRRAETPRDYFATLDFLPLMKPLFED